MSDGKVRIEFDGLEVGLKELGVDFETFINLKHDQKMVLLDDAICSLKIANVRLCSPETVRHIPKRKPSDKR